MSQGKRQRTVEAQLRTAEVSLSIVIGLLAGGVFAATTLGQLPVVLLAVPIAIAAGVLTSIIVAAIRRRAIDAD